MIIAVAMVRDEADIIAHTINQLLAQGVDHVLVADNLSTDATRPILEHLAGFGTVTVIDDPDPAYYQADKMTGLAHDAAELGASWVLPFDADEYWYSPHGTIADVLNNADGIDVVKAWGWDHVPRRDDLPLANPWMAHPWRHPETQKLPKVAFRPHPDVRVHMGNHDVDRPGHREDWLLAYRHMQYRSLPQMVRKLRNGAAAYRATDLHEMYGAHWRRADGLSDAEIAGEWEQILDRTDVVYDPCPTR